MCYAKERFSPRAYWEALVECHRSENERKKRKQRHKNQLQESLTRKFSKVYFPKRSKVVLKLLRNGIKKIIFSYWKMASERGRMRQVTRRQSCSMILGLWHCIWNRKTQHQWSCCLGKILSYCVSNIIIEV